MLPSIRFNPLRDAAPFWSAATWHRFSSARPGATSLKKPHSESHTGSDEPGLVVKSGARSPHSKFTFDCGCDAEFSHLPVFRDRRQTRLVVMLLVSLATACVARAASPRRAINVFLMAGQSNMAGADSIVPVPPGFISTEADRQTLFTCAPATEGARSSRYYPWGELKGHVGRPDELTHGPEVGFARRLHEAGIRNIAIVKVFANFKRDATAWPWREGGKLFTPWMAFVDERLAELRERGFEPQVRGFVWFQGIDDAIHGKLAAHYEQNLADLIAALRRRHGSADTLFILARSVDSPIGKRQGGAGPDGAMAVVRRAQVAVAGKVPRAAWISVDDLPNVNQHHFSAESQLVIGRRLGDAYLELMQPKQGKK
ncbi:MAG: hypothetical protein EXS37_14570 [Opitutus sp.]|nr:hypothetical protein [Opitutus sp.]